MENYKPNSHRYKESQKELSEKKVEKIVNGKVKTKKNDARKFRDIFISEDISNVKSYVFMDVLVPAIKNAIVDIVTDGINMIFGTGASGRKKTSGSNYVSYRDYSRSSTRPTVSTSNRFDYDDIVFETRGEAEMVLDQMDALIERYGYVTVSDIYDMVDISAPYTSNKYGWTNLHKAEVVHVREGYVIKLPRAMPID